MELVWEVIAKRKEINLELHHILYNDYFVTSLDHHHYVYSNGKQTFTIRNRDLMLLDYVLPPCLLLCDSVGVIDVLIYNNTNLALRSFSTRLGVLIINEIIIQDILPTSDKRLVLKKFEKSYGLAQIDASKGLLFIQVRGSNMLVWKPLLFSFQLVFVYIDQKPHFQLFVNSNNKMVYYDHLTVQKETNEYSILKKII
jgi:hypothetical protein